MKKGLKIILIVLGVLVGIIVLDTLQALAFNNSPILHIRDYINRCDENDYIDKGILINHYNCNNEIKTLFKSTKYDCMVCYTNNNQDKEFDYKVVTEETKNCNNIPVLYYDTSEQNIYTYCLDKISFKNNEEQDEMRYFLNGRYNIYESFINSLEFTKTNEEGIKIYQDNKKISNNGLTIIKCNTSDGNKDIYFGPKNMKIMNGFCKRKHKTVLDFIRTYIVEKVENENDYYNLTLSEFQGEQNVTVKVDKKLISNIKENQYYEFTFKSVGKKINEDIKTIFENAELIKIQKTDKVGLDTYMDSVR